MTAIAVRDGDIYLDDTGNLAMVSGIQRVLQQCEQVMKLQLGEAVYNMQRGIPYMDTVFDRLLIDRFIASGRQNLLSVPNVQDVRTFEAQVNGATLSYFAVIITTFGEGRIRG